MSSCIAKQPAFFNIRRLTEMVATGADDIRDEIIEMFLVLNGEVALVGKEFSVLLESNNLYCISWNKYNRAEIKKGTDGYVIHFSKTMLYSGGQEFYCSHFPAFYTLALREEVIQVETSFWGEGKKICEMIQQEFENENDFKMQIVGGFMSILLLHLMRKSNIFMYDTGSGNRHMLVRKFNVLLEEKFRTIKKVSDYAALLFVTPNYLNNIIKQVTGNSAGFHIRQRIASEAVRQAKLTGASMKEVALELGFNDNAHFSKFFKKAAGKNFSEIREYLFSKTMVSFNRM